MQLLIPTAFTKTLHTLDRATPVAALLRLGVAVAVLAGLGYWMTSVPVALFETSPDARLEIDSSATDVQSSMTGRIIESNLALGRIVKKGDLLLRMDSRPERLAVNEQQTKITAIEPQIKALNDQIEKEESTGQAEVTATAAAIEEANLRVREIETSSKVALEDRKRYEALRKQKLASEREIEKGIAESERLDRVLATATATVKRLEREQQTRNQQRLVRIAALRADITKLETSRAGARAAAERAGYDVELREIRSPIDGTIGEAAVLLPGSVLSEGTHLASILPQGKLRIVALFPPQAAYGRILPGSAAKLRLKGYPWTEFGVVEARVTKVAGENQDGKARVELEVLTSPTLKTELHHAMPGELEVEVEHTYPLQLVLRTVGQWLTAVRKS